MQKIGIALLLVVLIAAPSFAEPEPGPTSQPDFGPIRVIGKKLAEKTQPPDEILLKSLKAEGDVVFPQTFIRGDSKFTFAIDEEAGTVEAVLDNVPLGLSETMEQAVQLAPAWLRTALVDRFLHQIPADAEVLADLILNPSDTRFTDEFAFLIAMMGDRDLNDSNIADLLEENVRLIYEYDAFLDYVEVVDHGAPGDEDYYTTVEYIVNVDGTPETFELPYEIYYWNIVHPKLDMETVSYIDPSTGNKRSPANGGVFWRDYLWNDAPDDDSYTAAYFMRNPNVITEEELQDWGNTTNTMIVDRDIYNLDIVFHENGDPVLVEISFGKGTLLLTTMEVEQAFTDDESNLLINLITYGCGDMTIETDKTILVLGDATDAGTFADLVKTELDTLGYTDVNTITPAEFSALSEEDLGAVRKIIVPSRQSHEVYEVLTQSPTKGLLETWLSTGYKVLELHLATEETEDISGLTFPGGLAVDEPAASPTDTVVLAGRPLLSEIIADADHVWDGVVYPSLSGDRPFADDGTMALSLIGNWIAKNTMDNISEYMGKHGSMTAERAIQPSRIVYNHFGNCGEVQDVWTAAQRTCLIPGLNVSDTNEDHVWNEFYHDGDWFYLQNDWSGASTRIATPGGGQDEDYRPPEDDGGKTTSFIFGWMGSGEIYSVIERYSNFITFVVEITDSAGKPVPGAMIYLASEGYYSPSLNLSYVMFTDADGRAEVSLGDNRNYYLRVQSSGAGSWPSAVAADFFQVIEADDAQHGASFTFQQEMHETLYGDVTVEDEEDSSASLGAHIQFDLKQRFQRLSQPFNGVTYTLPQESMGINVFLVNEENLKDCRQGKDSYTVARAWEGVSTFDETIIPPEDGGPWYVVLSNAVNPASTVTLDVTAEPAESADDDTEDQSGGDDDDGDDEDSCCGC